jgi:hypothetical protein
LDVPATTPVTTPEELTVAIDAELLLHVPPLTLLVRDVAEPAQTVSVPAIAAGAAFTVTTFVRMHPENSKYVIVAVPEDTPVTTPLVSPTVAIESLPLIQLPPVVVFVKVVVAPEHTVAVPPIVPGRASTVTTVVDLHPPDGV